MPLRLRSAGGGSVLLKPPVAQVADVSMEVPAYDGAKLLTDKTPGTVLQVVHGTLSTTFVGTSVLDNGGYFIDVSNLTATITPKFLSSKILVTLSLYMGLTSTASGYQQSYRLKKLVNGVSSFPVLGDAVGGRPRSTGRINMYGTDNATHKMGFMGGTHQDSPNTLSAVTYQVQVGGYSSSTIMYVNRSEAFQYQANDYDTVPVSTITLMEIAG